MLLTIKPSIAHKKLSGIFEELLLQRLKDQDAALFLSISWSVFDGTNLEVWMQNF